MHSRTLRRVSAVSALLLFYCISAAARPPHLAAWQDLYPASLTDDNLQAPSANCQVCHATPSGGDGWNAYGWHIRELFNAGRPIGEAIMSAEALNSDNDPTATSNLAEIDANTQPGWTSGANNTLFFKNGTTTMGQNPPVVVGDVDPVDALADIALSPDALSFGTVTVGSNATLESSIGNPGGAVLIVSGISLCAGTSAEYSVSAPATPFEIAPGASQTIGVTYEPTDLSSDVGCISIASNDVDEPTVELAVSGEGTDVSAAQDVDIVKFNVTRRVDIGNDEPVNIAVDVANSGTVDGAVNIEVVGMQSESEIYNQTVIIDSSTIVGNALTVDFPAFTVTQLGDINWVVSVQDADPDEDTAGASTRTFGDYLGDGLDDPIAAPIMASGKALRLELVSEGLDSPLHGTPAPGIDGYLFVVDQPGKIYAVNLADGSKTVVLDVSPSGENLLVPLGLFPPLNFDERGLLGLAFHPDFQVNGLLYTYTSEPVSVPADFSTMPVGIAPDHQAVIRQWHSSAPSDPLVTFTMSKEVMRVDQPQFNHDGGTLAFGPDGMLYISFGDGGSADDQGDGHGTAGNGQDATNPLGAILRIDPLGDNSANGRYGIPGDNPFAVEGDSRLDEIFAYGLRNVFRFSFDRETGLMYGGDVGQNDIEEINQIVSGGNYGWPLKEGTFFFDNNGTNPGFVTDVDPGGLPIDLIDPIAQYDHDEGISAMGGYVYRGERISSLRGAYVFGEWSRGFFTNEGRVLYFDPNRLSKRDGTARVLELVFRDRDSIGLSIQGLGEDAAGEIYIMGNTTGTPFGGTGIIYRLAP